MSTKRASEAASPAVVEAAQELTEILKSEAGPEPAEDIAATLARTAENLSKAVAADTPKGKGERLKKADSGGDGEGPGGMLISGRGQSKDEDDEDSDDADDYGDEEDDQNPDGQQNVRGGDEESQKSLFDGLDAAELLDDREGFYKSLLDDPMTARFMGARRSGEDADVADGSPAIQHMAMVFGQALERLTKSQQRLIRRLDRIEGNQALQMKSQAILHKSMRGGVKPVSPGVVGTVGTAAAGT